ncbi:MAG: glycosyltransferase [Thermodesulfobacteriota bacterium]|jgi:glycosyltransferase involved in cell wall biosynthesis
MTNEILEKQKRIGSLKVALVHDWLTGMRGGEKCLEIFCEIFPQADLYTLLHVKGSVSPTIEKHRILTTWAQHLPGVEKKYRHYLPLFPLAVRSMNLKGYDLVLSSSHCVAKGVRVYPPTLHISYIFTPVRYVWDMYDIYFGKESSTGLLVRVVMPFVAAILRHWDVRTSQQVDYLLADSENVRRRILKYYHREAEVIPVPVDTKHFDLSFQPRDYYLMVTALAPYKRIDLAVRAFNRSQKPLIIVGTGPLMESLQKESGKNIIWLGWQSNENLKKLYGECLALIFPGEEDAGITPLEAQASGRPVVAFGRGGALETVVPLEEYLEGRRDFFSGIFFREQMETALLEAVERLEQHAHLLNPEKIRNHSLQFDREIFKERMIRTIVEKLKLVR